MDNNKQTKERNMSQELIREQRKVRFRALWEEIPGNKTSDKIRWIQTHLPGTPDNTIFIWHMGKKAIRESKLSWLESMITLERQKDNILI